MENSPQATAEENVVVHSAEAPSLGDGVLSSPIAERSRDRADQPRDQQGSFVAASTVTLAQARQKLAAAEAAIPALAKAADDASLAAATDASDDLSPVLEARAKLQRAIERRDVYQHSVELAQRAEDARLAAARLAARCSELSAYRQHLVTIRKLAERYSRLMIQAEALHAEMTVAARHAAAMHPWPKPSALAALARDASLLQDRITEEEVSGCCTAAIDSFTVHLGLAAAPEPPAVVYQEPVLTEQQQRHNANVQGYAKANREGATT